MYSNYHLPVIAFPFHYASPGRGFNLNKKCVVDGYHLCCFEVNVGEVFTANKKGEWGNTFKVINHHEHLGHLQSKLVNPRGVEEKEESIVLLFSVNIQSIKIKSLYNYWVQRGDIMC